MYYLMKPYPYKLIGKMRTFIFIYRIMENRTVFNDAQLHVLEMASRIKTAHGLEELKDQLAAYYARRIDEDMEALWQSGHWNEKKIEELKGAHYRTPYKQ